MTSGHQMLWPYRKTQKAESTTIISKFVELNKSKKPVLISATFLKSTILKLLLEAIKSDRS